MSLKLYLHTIPVAMPDKQFQTVNLNYHYHDYLQLKKKVNCHVLWQNKHKTDMDHGEIINK